MLPWSEITQYTCSCTVIIVKL